MATHFLRDDDLTPAQQAEVLSLAAAMKADRFARRHPQRWLIIAGFLITAVGMILLLAPVAAVPSNCPHVLLRIVSGRDGAKYTDSYRGARELMEAQVPATLAARRRAYLLLQRHGRELCKAKEPRCGACPVSAACAWRARRIRRP